MCFQKLWRSFASKTQCFCDQSFLNFGRICIFVEEIPHRIRDFWSSWWASLVLSSSDHSLFKSFRSTWKVESRPESCRLLHSTLCKLLDAKMRDSNGKLFVLVHSFLLNLSYWDDRRNLQKNFLKMKNDWLQKHWFLLAKLRQSFWKHIGEEYHELNWGTFWILVSQLRQGKRFACVTSRKVSKAF